MTQVSAFEEAVSQIEDIDRRIAATVKDRPEDWRRDLIKARRELADLLTQASLALGDLQLADQSQVEELRKKLSAFRGAVAIHQAGHPASSIEQQSGYDQSNDTVKKAGRDFLNFVRLTLHSSRPR